MDVQAVTVAGWIERQNGRKASNFLAYLKALKAEGFDVTALVASDYSHAIAIVCDASAICADKPHISWLEPEQLPLFNGTTVGFNDEPPAHTRRLLNTLGVTWHLDPDAPDECPCGCRATERFARLKDRV